MKRGSTRRIEMRRVVATCLLAVGIAIAGSVGGGIKARAIEDGPPAFGSCGAMHHYRFPNGIRGLQHGVARTKAAARRQVADGFYRPPVSRYFYNRDRKLDRDHDHTVCEVRRR
jgi:hypothetical protein